MKNIWIPPNHKKWWRIHNQWKTDISQISKSEWAIERAREIAVNNPIELIKQKIYWFKSVRNSYWPDPFPPRF